MFPVPPLKFRTSGFPQYGFKLELNRNLRHRQHNLNARHICITLTMTYMQLKSWSLFLVILTDNLTIAELTAMTIQSRDPWLSCGLCCPTGSSLTMVSSETLDPLATLFFFVQQVFALLPRMGWYRELPQFAQHIFSIVLYTVPRRSKRLLSAVASPFTLAFTLFG